MANGSPSTHDIGIAAKDLAQTADHNIRILRHLDIDKVANRLVDHNDKAILVCQFAYTCEIGTG